MPDEDGSDNGVTGVDVAVAGGVIDVAVHPNPSSDAELRSYLSDEFRERPFPGPFRYLYPPPTGIAPYGEFLAEARESVGLPASSPSLVRDQLDRRGTSTAVLVPQTRGQLPSGELGAAICSATNRWLAERWLEDPATDGFLGTIRVDAMNPDVAVAEIERWAAHPGMVQVGVPLEALHPYGHRYYAPIWAAAAHHGLPVAVHTDGVSGTSYHPTPGGFPRHYIEFAALYPSNFIYHLTSLIVEGVFERLPDLRFVFTDGGFDVLMPLMWRFDMDWPISRTEAPWVRRRPSLYLADHVRFAPSRLEGPRDELVSGQWIEISRAADLLMYASSYPRWTAMRPADLPAGLSDAGRTSVLGGNARRFYPRLSATVPTTSAPTA